MRARHFDRRVAHDPVVALLRAATALVPCRVSGDLPLSAIHLHHRQADALTLLCHATEDVYHLLAELPRLAPEASLDSVETHDGRVRLSMTWPDSRLDVVIVADSRPALGPPERVEEVVVDSFTDLRVRSLVALATDLRLDQVVDAFFTDRAGYPVEDDLLLALREEPGIDPGVLAWRLRDVPLEPLPKLLEPTAPLAPYRDALAERVRAIAVPR